jgi:multidrug resistance efflux pump
MNDKMSRFGKIIVVAIIVVVAALIFLVAGRKEADFSDKYIRAISAPANGVITGYSVKDGDYVQRGDTLMTFETVPRKTELEIIAPAAGWIRLEADATQVKEKQKVATLTADLSGASTGRTNTYSRYIERLADAPAGRQNIQIDLFSYTSANGVSVLEFFEGERRVLRTEEDSYVEYRVNVESAGLYNMRMEYFPLPSRGIPRERTL